MANAFNVTNSDQTHRIIILSPKRTTDRTVYNFISYRYYISSQKKKIRKINSCIKAEKELNDRITSIIIERDGNAYEDQTTYSYPVQIGYSSQLISDL